MQQIPTRRQTHLAAACLADVLRRVGHSRSGPRGGDYQTPTNQSCRQFGERPTRCQKIYAAHIAGGIRRARLTASRSWRVPRSSERSGAPSNRNHLLVIHSYFTRTGGALEAGGLLRASEAVIGTRIARTALSDPGSPPSNIPFLHDSPHGSPGVHHDSWASTHLPLRIGRNIVLLGGAEGPLSGFPRRAIRPVFQTQARRDRRDAPLTTPTTTPPRVPLSVLRSGDRAVVEFDALAHDEAQLLEAMGLTDQSEVRICRSGSPCIIEVAQMRLGLAASVAHRIYATPCGEECPAVRDSPEHPPA